MKKVISKSVTENGGIVAEAGSWRARHSSMYISPSRGDKRNDMRSGLGERVRTRRNRRSYYAVIAWPSFKTSAIFSSKSNQLNDSTPLYRKSKSII